MSFRSRPRGSDDDDLSDDAAETVGAATVVADGGATAMIGAATALGGPTDPTTDPAVDNIAELVGATETVTTGPTSKHSLTELGGMTPTDETYLSGGNTKTAPNVAASGSISKPMAKTKSGPVAKPALNLKPIPGGTVGSVVRPLPTGKTEPMKRPRSSTEEQDVLDEPTLLMTGDQTDQVKLRVPDAARRPLTANTIPRATAEDTEPNVRIDELRARHTDDTRPRTLPTASAAKKTLGGYRVTGVLASGQMGVVYRGEHPTQRKTAVAIKSVQGELQTNPAVVARFFAESIVLARIDHPNVVRFHDFGYDAEGSAYLIMELLQGETLTKRLTRERRLDISSATDIALQVTQGLAAAHKQGVIHRDVKPDNIFLCSDGTVKLLDFGVAKLDGQGPTQTLQGDLLGTAAYMAPEQGRSASDSDARSDLYSVGCILFEMVTGVVPFPGSLVETLVAHQSAERPPARALNPDVSTELDTIIDRLMARDPAARPQNAVEVIKALGALESTTERPVRRVRRAPLRSGTLISAHGAGNLRIKLESIAERIRAEPIALGLLIAVIVLLIALIVRH
jgi:hypothetical protein